MSIFTRAFNRMGYGPLASAFPGGPDGVGAEPQGARWDRTCVQFGSMRYDWCVTVIVARDGLWVRAKPPLQGQQPPILVPWPAIREARPTRLYWRPAARLSCGSPEVGTIIVWQPVWAVAAPLWQSAFTPPQPGMP